MALETRLRNALVVTHRPPENLLDVIEEIILRQLADGGQRGLSFDAGLGEVGGGGSEVHSAQRVLLLGTLKFGGIEVGGLRLGLVGGIAIKNALRRNEA